MRSFLLALGLAYSIFSCSDGNPARNSNGIGSTDVQNLSYELNVNGCSTHKQTFSSKAAYCAGLTSRQLNHACAREERKTFFLQNCGNHFEESSIPAVAFSGFDLTLNQECRTGEPPVAVFSSLGDFCHFLEDETLHQNCFWADRKAEFQRSECPGTFSPEPIGNSDNRPKPSPEPSHNSSSEQPSDPESAIQKDLEAAGIKVAISASPIDGNLPGEKTFRERLAAFWPVLATVENALVQRREGITRLTLADYAAYESEYSSLTLSVDMSETDIKRYLAILDRRTAWSKAMGMTLDAGIDIYGDETDKTAAAEALTAFLETNSQKLQAFKGAVRKLSLSDESYYFLYSRELRIEQKNYQKELLANAAYFASVAPFFTWADANNVKIDGDLKLEEQPKVFLQLFSQMQAEEPTLGELVNLGLLAAVDFSQNRDKAYFIGSTLSPASDKPGLDINGKMIEALKFQYETAKDLGIKIENSLGLDQDYLTAAERLKTHIGLIQEKKSGISMIKFSDKSQYAGKLLFIGYEDSDQDLVDALNKIP